MKSNDIMNREEVRGLMQQAIRDNDNDAFAKAFDKMLGCIETDIKEEYEQRVGDLQQEMDSRILAARGVRQLTSEERNYFQKLGEAMKAKDPKQALANLDVAMPTTTIDAVFDELQTAHPLLSRINFRPSGGAVKVIMNTNGYQEAAWGELCDEIVKELTSGFKKIDTMLLKLSAFVPVCKAMVDLGPEWLENYVRQVLYEALSNGMEAGFVTGDGNGKPIGMTRQVGDTVTVVGGSRHNHHGPRRHVSQRCDAIPHVYHPDPGTEARRGGDRHCLPLSGAGRYISRGPYRIQRPLPFSGR